MAISSGVGGRPSSWASRADAFRIFESVPTRLSGSRTVRTWSLRALRIDWRTHQTAYEMNLNPRVSSNRWAALTSP